MYYLKSTAMAVLLLAAVSGHAQQIINAYAEVTAISGTTLSIGDVNVTYDQFEVGDQVILMQMQDATINTNYNTNFGTIQDAGAAGLYEDLTIESIVPGGTSVTNETIWFEDFEDLNNGATSDTGETAWERSCDGGGTGCYTGGGPNQRSLQVRNNPTINGNRSFSGVNLDAVAYWTSEDINISGYTDVALSVAMEESGFDNNADYLRAYYQIDGGTQIEMGYTSTPYPRGNFNSATATASGLSGNTVTIIVKMMCNANNDYPIIDDIEVTGDKTVTTIFSITLSSGWVNSYETGANSAVQLISFPTYNAYTSTDDLTALEWNGTIGGVFAIDVEGVFTLEHDIDLTGLGFQGGSQNPTQNSTACDGSNQVYYSDGTGYALKGEGIYKSTNDDYSAGIGYIANGAGGASYHNAGGGGGGNFTAGGAGGPGWSQYDPNNECDPSGGGYGGVDLSDYISADRIYMGGGGGGGQQNNSMAGAAGDGGDGGGIIIIKADEIVTTGGCASLNVAADGESKGDADSDGGGGAGAGGSILFQVNTWSLDCDINVSASGGDGSDILNTDTHGGGGGGGKGVIIFSGAMPASDLTATNDEGEGGNNRSGAGATTADSGETDPENPDADDDGIVETEEGPLPVTLLYWNGSKDENVVVLRWATATEINNDYFTIEKSLDGNNWTHVAYVEGQGSTSTLHEYELEDAEAHSKVYYRLMQTDFDGQYEVFDVLLIQSVLNLTNVLLYPNPNNGVFQVQLPDSNVDVESVEIQLIDQTGRAMPINAVNDAGILNFDVSSFPKGQYLLQIKSGNSSKLVRVMIN